MNKYTFSLLFLSLTACGRTDVQVYTMPGGTSSGTDSVGTSPTETDSQSSTTVTDSGSSTTATSDSGSSTSTSGSTGGSTGSTTNPDICFVEDPEPECPLDVPCAGFDTQACMATCPTNNVCAEYACIWSCHVAHHQMEADCFAGTCEEPCRQNLCEVEWDREMSECLTRAIPTCTTESDDECAAAIGVKMCPSGGADPTGCSDDTLGLVSACIQLEQSNNPVPPPECMFGPTPAEMCAYSQCTGAYNEVAQTANGDSRQTCAIKYPQCADVLEVDYFYCIAECHGAKALCDDGNDCSTCTTELNSCLIECNP